MWIPTSHCALHKCAHVLNYAASAQGDNVLVQVGVDDVAQGVEQLVVGGGHGAWEAMGVRARPDPESGQGRTSLGEWRRWRSRPVRAVSARNRLGLAGKISTTVTSKALPPAWTVH